MPAECSVCRHPQAKDIDRSLRHASVNETAAAYEIPRSTMQRHKANHWVTQEGVHTSSFEPPPPSLADDEPGPTDAAEWIARLSEELRDLITHAKSAGTIRDRTATLAAALPLVEKLGRLTGELGPDREVGLLKSPEWVAFRTATVDALRPHPEALEAVVGAWDALARGVTPAASP